MARAAVPLAASAGSPRLPTAARYDFGVHGHQPRLARDFHDMPVAEREAPTAKVSSADPASPGQAPAAGVRLPIDADADRRIGGRGPEVHTVSSRTNAVPPWRRGSVPRSRAGSRPPSRWCRGWRAPGAEAARYRARSDRRRRRRAQLLLRPEVSGGLRVAVPWDERETVAVTGGEVEEAAHVDIRDLVAQRQLHQVARVRRVVLPVLPHAKQNLGVGIVALNQRIAPSNSAISPSVHAPPPPPGSRGRPRPPAGEAA